MLGVPWTTETSGFADASVSSAWEEGWTAMQTIALDQSVAMIRDGASLMIGGFMAVGTPEGVIDELVRQKKRDLTVIANDTALPGQGIGKLIGAKLVRKAIVSHIGLNP